MCPCDKGQWYLGGGLSAGWGRWLFPSAQDHGDDTWSTVSSSGTYWSKSRGEPEKMIKGLQHLTREGGWECWDCSAEGRQRGILEACIYTWWMGIETVEPDPSQWKARDNGHKLKHRKFHLNTWKSEDVAFYCEDGQILEQASQKDCGISILGDAQNLTERVPQQVALADPALSRGVGLLISGGPFDLHNSSALSKNQPGKIVLREVVLRVLCWFNFSFGVFKIIFMVNQK